VRDLGVVADARAVVDARSRRRGDASGAAARDDEGGRDNDRENDDGKS
jgi:hypothetical protein